MVETLGIPLEILAKYWWLVAGGQALATSYQPPATSHLCFPILGPECTNVLLPVWIIFCF